MCKNKIFMKGRQRSVLYWKQIYSIGLARNPFRNVLLIMSLVSRFHALRVVPKTIGHEVKAVCVKLIKQLIILKNTRDYFTGHENMGLDCIF